MGSNLLHFYKIFTVMQRRETKEDTMDKKVVSTGIATHFGYLLFWLSIFLHKIIQLPLLMKVM